MTGSEVRSWGVSQIYDDDLRQRGAFGDEEVLWPVFEGLSMGWSWSLFFCQEMATELATRNLPRGRRGLAAERTPPPPLLPGYPITGVYVDNINTIGYSKLDAVEADGLRRCRRRSGHWRPR